MRPEPGFSLYEGRTRGKRIKYTYSDEEGAGSDVSLRKSSRPSGISTPAEPAAPTYTASGRQVRSKHGATYGGTTRAGHHEQKGDEVESGMDVADDEDDQPVIRRPRRFSGTNGIRPRGRPKKLDESASSEESDIGSDTPSSHDWNNMDDDPDDRDENDDDEMSDEEEDEQDELQPNQGSLVVALRYGKGKSASPQVNGSSRDLPHEAPISGHANDLMPTKPPQIMEVEMMDSKQMIHKAASETGANGAAPASDMVIPKDHPPQAPIQQSNITVHSQPSPPIDYLPSEFQLDVEAPPLTNPHAFVFEQKELPKKD